jgi:hypothetical protein
MTYVAARDYTGVSTRELGEIFQRFFPEDAELLYFAQEVGIDDRELKRIVYLNTYQWVGLDKADRILLGLGLNISHLASIGEITIIPASNKRAAIQMAGDEFWAKGETPSPDELETRADELRKLRGWVLGPKTDLQEQVSEKERQRKK